MAVLNPNGTSVQNKSVAIAARIMFGRLALGSRSMIESFPHSSAVSECLMIIVGLRVQLSAPFLELVGVGSLK